TKREQSACKGVWVSGCDDKARIADRPGERLDVGYDQGAAEHQRVHELHWKLADRPPIAQAGDRDDVGAPGEVDPCSQGRATYPGLPHLRVVRRIIRDDECGSTAIILERTNG